MAYLPQVYFSYAWGDGETPEGKLRTEVAEVLYSHLKDREENGKLQLMIDHEKLHYKSRISEFTKQYADAALVVMIISDKYLRSKYCMGEAVEVLTNRDYRKRIFAVVLPDAEANINDSIRRASYVQYWEQKKEELSKIINKFDGKEHAVSFFKELKDIAEIIRIIGDFTEEICDTISVKPPNYEPLLSKLDQRVEELRAQSPHKNLKITGDLAVISGFVA